MRFIFFLLLFSCTTQPKDPYSFKDVKLVRVVDGDTIIVDIKDVGEFFGKNAVVRLKNIDAPEIHSQDKCELNKAIQARTALEILLVSAKKINLETAEKDKYGRILANVTADGIDSSLKLLDLKLAVPYHGEKKEPRNWCIP